MEAGLSLGSNVGDRLANLVEAKNRIAALPGLSIVAQSPVYETEPVGVKPQYRELKFLNAVVIIECPVTGHECFDRFRKIEDDLGRQRTLDRFAPRPIDIDVVYVGDLRIQSGGLCIPHAHWHERRFVVQPLADIRPDLVLPGQRKPVREILAELPPGDGVTLFAREW